MLQLANARLRAHFLTPSPGRGSVWQYGDAWILAIGAYLGKSRRLFTL
jgi:hypothetical protein